MASLTAGAADVRIAGIAQGLDPVIAATARGART